MNSTQIKADKEKVPRIFWRTDEWLRFTATFLKKYRRRDPLSAKFMLSKAEFSAVQKLVIEPVRQRSIYNDVLLKASARIARIITEYGADELRTEQNITEHMWTKQDFIVVANQLHLQRPDLKLLFADEMTGFSVSEFQEAQSTLPLDKHFALPDISKLSPSLKAAYKTIRGGHSSTTITKGNPQRARALAAAPGAKAGSIVRWGTADFDLIAKEILRRNPASSFLSDDIFASVSPKEVFESQREALAIDRRRDRASISQTIKTIRKGLATAGEPMLGNITNNATPPVRPSVPKRELGTRVFNGLAKGAEVPRQVTVQSEPNLAKTKTVEISLSAPDLVEKQPEDGDAIGSEATVDAILAAARPFVSMLVTEFSRSLASVLAPQVAEILMKGNLAAAVASAISAQHSGTQAPLRSGTATADTVIPQSEGPKKNAVAIEESRGDAEALTAASVTPAPIPTPVKAMETAYEVDADDSDSGVNGNVAAAPDCANEVDDADLPNGNVALPDPTPQAAQFSEDFTAEDAAILRRNDAHQSKIVETRVTKTIADTSNKVQIGIIGVKGQHELELKHLYPDVHFVCTDSTSSQSMANFSKCYRVMGVEGFVNPMAHALSSKTLADRYTRYSGGFPAIKSQIATLLRRMDSGEIRAA